MVFKIVLNDTMQPTAHAKVHLLPSNRATFFTEMETMYRMPLNRNTQLFFRIQINRKWFSPIIQFRCFSEDTFSRHNMKIEMLQNRRVNTFAPVKINGTKIIQNIYLRRHYSKLLGELVDYK